MCIELDKPTIKIVSKPTPLLVPVFTLCALAPVVNELMRCLNVAPHDMREVLEIAKSSKDAVSTRFDGTSNWPNGAEKFRICYETFPQRVSSGAPAKDMINWAIIPGREPGENGYWLFAVSGLRFARGNSKDTGE